MRYMENSLTRCPVLRTLTKALVLIGVFSAPCFADPSGPAGNYIRNSRQLTPSPSTLNVSSGTIGDFHASTITTNYLTVTGSATVGSIVFPYSSYPDGYITTHINGYIFNDVYLWRVYNDYLTGSWTPSYIRYIQSDNKLDISGTTFSNLGIVSPYVTASNLSFGHIPYASFGGKLDNSPITWDGATFDFLSQNINTTGAVTSNTFYGDGSNLTGISAGGSQIYPSTDVPSFPYGVATSSLTVQDANSSYQVFLGTLPKNGGFGPQSVEQGVWSQTNGSYQSVVTTVSRVSTSGGAPYIPADGASLIYSPSSLSYSTYTYRTPTGTQVWGVDSTGFAIPSLANNSVIGTDSSGYLVAGTAGGAVNPSTGPWTFPYPVTGSTVTATSYQSVLSSNTTTSINWQSGDAKTQTITASSTYTFTNLPTGTTNKTLNMRVINTGSFKMTWPSTIKWTSGVSGSSPTASAVTIYTFQVFDGTVYGAFIAGFPR